MGLALEDALVGRGGPDVNVNPDEISADGGCDRQRGLRVVPEDVDPERTVDLAPDGRGDQADVDQTNSGDSPRPVDLDFGSICI